MTAGSGREMCNIIERLDKNVFDIIIAVNEAGGTLFDEMTDKGYTILVHPFSAENANGLINKLKQARTISQYYKPYAFDIWQSFNWSSDYTEALVAKFAGAKYVYVKKNMNWNRRAWKVKSLFATAIVVRNSTMVNTMFSHKLYKHKTYYITGGVDTQLFYKKLSSFRNKLPIPVGATMIVCVAQMVRVKDQAALIKAVAGLDNCYLILAGRFVDAAYVKELQQLISSLDLQQRVLLLGAVAEINDLLNAADIFVLPTSGHNGHEEGCPVALLEAMAAQVPCIASNVAGNNDLIEHQKTGLLFSPGDVDGLTNCIKQYMEDRNLVARILSNANSLIHARHQLDQEAEKFADVYYKLTKH
jgi:glycosyltransferase involved in cell wall biosynthesis